MPTNNLQTLQLLPWILASIGIFGLTFAVVALARLRRAKLVMALEQARSAERESKASLSEAARRELF